MLVIFGALSIASVAQGTEEWIRQCVSSVNAEWVSVSCQKLYPESSGVLWGVISTHGGGEAGELFLAGIHSPVLLDEGVVLKTEDGSSAQKLANFSRQK